MSLNKEYSPTGVRAGLDITGVDSMMKICSLDTQKSSGISDREEAESEGGGTAARLSKVGHGLRSTIPTDEDVLKALRALRAKDKEVMQEITRKFLNEGNNWLLGKKRFALLFQACDGPPSTIPTDDDVQKALRNLHAKNVTTLQGACSLLKKDNNWRLDTKRFAKLVKIYGPPLEAEHGQKRRYKKLLQWYQLKVYPSHESDCSPVDYIGGALATQQYFKDKSTWCFKLYSRENTTTLFRLMLGSRANSG
jgi:hypothetical protein